VVVRKANVKLIKKWIVAGRKYIAGWKKTSLDISPVIKYICVTIRFYRNNKKKELMNR
jgi:hypothetical protein